MLAFVARRVVFALPLLFVSSFLVYVMVANAGEPYPVENARLNPRVSEAQRRAIELRFNLHEPVVVRYWHWLSGAVKGDLGSDNEGRPVWPQIRHGLVITLRLILVAVVVAVVLAVVVGSFSAIRQYSFFDYLSTFSAFLFFSLPVFWVGALLKYDLAIRFNEWIDRTVFYTIGHESVRLPDAFLSRLGDYAGHMFLPVLTLVLISYASYSRFVRASMLETLNADYIRTARAKGVSERRIIARHALRNGLIPVTTVVAIDFGALFGGAIITERIFQWRGMGTILIDGINEFDVNMVQGWVMVSAVTVVIFSTLADVVYALIDPRIRL